MTPDAFRKLAMSLPEVVESAHVDHPDYRVGKKIFATLGYPDTAWGVVKLTPQQQGEFVAAYPSVFAPVKGGWGIRGSTQIKLRTATSAALRPALRAAWRNAATTTRIRKHAGLARRGRSALSSDR